MLSAVLAFLPFHSSLSRFVLLVFVVSDVSRPVFNVSGLFLVLLPSGLLGFVFFFFLFLLLGVLAFWLLHFGLSLVLLSAGLLDFLFFFVLFFFFSLLPDVIDVLGLISFLGVF